MEEKPKRKYKKHKQGYSISIKHVLRKDKGFLERLFTKKEPDGDPRFPIYLRVSFQNQTVTMRSRMKRSVTESEFEAYQAKPEIDTLFACETAAIRKSIEELQPDRIEGFMISQWSEYYTTWNTPVKEAVENWLLVEFGDLYYDECMKRDGEKVTMDDEMKLAIMGMCINLNAIKSLVMADYELASTFYGQYQPLFRCAEIEAKLNPDKTYTIGDWRLGFYRQFIHKAYIDGSDAYLSLLETALLFGGKRDFKFNKKQE
jgi:hypothetical protein